MPDGVVAKVRATAATLDSKAYWVAVKAVFDRPARYVAKTVRLIAANRFSVATAIVSIVSEWPVLATAENIRLAMIMMIPAPKSSRPMPKRTMRLPAMRDPAARHPNRTTLLIAI